MRIAIIAVAVVAAGWVHAGQAQEIEQCRDAYDKERWADALMMCKPLAEKGDAEAQYHLGWMYSNGQGVMQDYKATARLWGLAAKQSYPDAQSFLALMYLSGRGVPQDYNEAARLLELAAKQGFPDAQFNLGAMFDAGQGVPLDYVKAHMWLNVAATNGRHYAASNRETVASKMTREQLADAQERARKCLASNYLLCD